VAFNPINSPHSIERCSATVVFSENVPEKLLRKLIVDLSKTLPQGVSRTASRAFKFDVTTGQVTTEVEEGTLPGAFISADKQNQFMLAPNALSWTTERYVRWKPFVGQLDSFFGPVLDGVLEAVSPQSVRLEYSDRFNWAGDWNDFDVKTLLRADPAFVAQRVLSGDGRWHTHSGWFDKVDNLRRLTNVNIDVADLVGPMTPTVGIFTLMQDEANISGYGPSNPEDLNKAFIASRLENLHQGLKKLLADIIVPQMAEKIGLSS